MEHDRLIYIRADGNSHIASGHLMRCLTIADEIEKQGGRVCFVVSDSESKEALFLRMQGQKIPVLVLNSDYRNLEEELPKLSDLLLREENPVLLLDSYYVTPAYMEGLSKIAGVLYLDDLQLFDYPVAAVVNYDLQVDESFYKKAGSRFIGPAYAPIRENFSKGSYELSQKAQRLLLTTGGSDPDNFCGRFLEYVKKKPDGEEIKIELVIGSMFQHRDALVFQAKQMPNVTLHEKLNDLSELMKACDIAVSAGGTTLFELCAVGVPTVSISISENQIPCNQAFQDAAVIEYLGAAQEEGILERLYAKVMELRVNLAKRQDMHFRQQKAIDGMGAKRIASVLLYL